MFGPKLKVSQSLYEKLKLASQIRGASSLDEFVERVLEPKVDEILQQAGKKPVTKEEVDDITEKLKGLGYLE